MRQCDVLVVGGGPAGSTAARVLQKAGWDVAVIDRASFPRDKVCAGWVTPEVFQVLELTPADYLAEGLTLQTITGFRTGVLGGRLVDTDYTRPVSYAIRRCEFDTFLLRRAGCPVVEGTAVTSLQRDRGTWRINDDLAAPVVIGAGGHFCPVARHLRGGPDVHQPVVAKEAEFRLKELTPDLDGGFPALYFCRDMEGYGWCVRKGEYLNIGIGRRTNQDFAAHVGQFMHFLEEKHGLRQVTSVRWRGHAYLAAGAGPRPLVADGLLLIGDAAGLAYPESGEGIRPAVESGRLAAETLIAAGGRWEAESLRPYVDAIRRLHPPATRLPASVRAASAAIARWLLGSSHFTRHVLLDRWFLRAAAGQHRG